MKREMKRGAPLVRRTDPTGYTSGNPEELEPKSEFCKTLLQDIDQLQGLAQAVELREQEKVLLDQTFKEQLQCAYFPHNTLIRLLLAKINKIDSSRFLMDLETQSLNLSQINDKSVKNNYMSLNEFLTDLESFFQEVEAINSPALIKAVRRITRDIDTNLQELKDLDLSKLDRDFVMDGVEV